MSRRRALMVNNSESDILFDWNPSDGIDKLEFGGNYTTAPYVSGNDLVITSGPSHKYTYIKNNIQYADDYTLEVVINEMQAEGDWNIRTHTIGQNTRCNCYPHDAYWNLSGATQTDNFYTPQPTTSGIVKAVYNKAQNIVSYYWNNNKISDMSVGSTVASSVLFLTEYAGTPGITIKIGRITIRKGRH